MEKRGLSEKEARKRLDKYGFNEIKDTRDYTRELEFDSLDISNGDLRNLEDCLNRFYQTRQ